MADNKTGALLYHLGVLSSEDEAALGKSLAEDGEEAKSNFFQHLRQLSSLVTSGTSGTETPARTGVSSEAIAHSKNPVLLENGRPQSGIYSSPLLERFPVLPPFERLWMMLLTARDEDFRVDTLRAVQTESEQKTVADRKDKHSQPRDVPSGPLTLAADDGHQKASPLRGTSTKDGLNLEWEIEVKDQIISASLTTLDQTYLDIDSMVVRIQIEEPDGVWDPFDVIFIRTDDQTEARWVGLQHLAEEIGHDFLIDWEVVSQA